MRTGRQATLVLLLAGLTVAPASLARADDRPKVLLQAAERRAEEGDAEGAREDYEQLVRQFAESAEAPEALLRIAQSLRGSPEEALATVDRLLTDYPRAFPAAEALLLKAELMIAVAAGPEELEKVRSDLAKVWLLFPAHTAPELEARSRARVLDAELALRLDLGREAMSSCLEVIERERPSAWTAKAHVGLALSQLREGDWRAGAENLQAAIDSGLADAATEALARRRLSLIHRRHLRSGGTWHSAGPGDIEGAELRRPTAIAADDAGSLLIYDDRDSHLFKVSPGGAIENRWSLRGAERPSWGREGQALLALKEGVAVPSEPARHVFTAPGKTRSLEGLVAVELGPYGDWYLLTSGSAGLVAFDAAREQGRTLHSADGDPVDLASDARGRLYILERKSRRVVRLDPALGESETLVAGSWRRPAAIAVDALGFVYVLDSEAKRVEVFDAAGQPVESLGPGLPGSIVLERPQDLAVAGDGRLFLIDQRAGLVSLE